MPKNGHRKTYSGVWGSHLKWLILALIHRFCILVDSKSDDRRISPSKRSEYIKLCWN